MKVWQIEDAYGIDNLRQAERPEPQPGPGQVAVRMRAASLNYRDLLVVEGRYGGRGTLPLVPFSDGVGEVVAVGPGVERVAVGERVCPMFFQGWLAGAPTSDALATSLGSPLDGVLAETAVFDADGVSRVPEHLSDEEAACLPCAGLTAWSALIDQGDLRPGETVLIQGTGGVALFALQFAVLAGAVPIVISSSDAKVDRAREMGAAHAFNYGETPEWHQEVKRLTDGRGADHVIELGGAGTLAQSVRAVRVGGRVSLIGVLSGAAGQVDLPLVLMRQVRLQGVTVGPRAGFEAMCRAVARHAMQPMVDRVFGFDEVPDALRTLGRGGHFGKLCVRF